DDARVRGLTLDSQLAFAGDGAWDVIDGGRTLGRWDFSRIRVSVSWKAQVLRDAAEARCIDEHRDDLQLEQVLDTFLAHLAGRGSPAERPPDPLHDASFVATLSAVYRVAPSVFP